MKSIVIIFSFCLMWPCVAQRDLHFDTLAQGELLVQQDNKLDHSSWDALLKTYVDEKGNVNYEGLLQQKSQIKSYLDYLSLHVPEKHFTIEEQFAYYINLYNAAAIYLVVDQGIPQSIKDISGPWGRVWLKKFISIEDEVYSLNDIEKGVLQKMGDLRIHFAINCASISCPKLNNKAYTAQNISTLLEQAANDFVHSSLNDLTDMNRPRLSKIFDWYESDFENAGTTVIDFINVYLKNPIPQDAKISYLDYDWGLNKQ